MMRKHLAVAAFLMIIIVNPLRGSCQESAIPKGLQNDIVRLLDMTGSGKLGLQMGTAVANQVIDRMTAENPKVTENMKTALKDEISKLMAEKMPDLMGQIVKVYAKYFSQEEIKGLIAFYQTPLGQKTIRSLPQVVNECMLIGKAWGEGLEPELIRRIEARLKKDGLLNQ
jgi:hypothetical protein